MIKNKKDNLIKRTLFKQVFEHLKEKEMTVIIGPRQVGKTTLLEQLQDYLINKQGINRECLFYFNLDLAKNLALFEDRSKVYFNWLIIARNKIKNSRSAYRQKKNI